MGEFTGGNYREGGRWEGGSLCSWEGSLFFLGIKDSLPLVLFCFHACCPGLGEGPRYQVLVWPPEERGQCLSPSLVTWPVHLLTSTHTPGLPFYFFWDLSHPSGRCPEAQYLLDKTLLKYHSSLECPPGFTVRAFGIPARKQSHESLALIFAVPTSVGTTHSLNPSFTP